MPEGLGHLTARIVALVQALCCALAPMAVAADSPAPETGHRPMVVAVIGDSMALEYWRGLSRMLRDSDDVKLLRKARASTGLSRTDYFDWSTALANLIARTDIDAAIVAFGANDAQNLFRDAGRHLPYGSSEWDEQYLARVIDVMEQFKQADIPVIWVTLPIVKDVSFADRLSHLNALYESVIPQYGADLIDAWALTQAADGNYAARLRGTDGRMILVRDADGVHFTRHGETMMATHILGRLRERLASAAASM